MANDYRVVLSGEDKLSVIVKNVRNELDGTGKSATKLDEIKRKFDRIQNSAAPLKNKLRSLRELMANMNMDGLSNTDVFGQMAEQAGQYADAIGDAQTAVRAFANDNMKLQAVTEGFQLITGAVGIATGAMSLLGVENKNVEQAMLKVQSAISVMNGVQQVANLLNKDSVLMLRLKQLAIVANTAATARATVVEGAATVSTKVSTIAQTAWNVAKAVAKALLGDFSGLLLVGAGVLATYAIATATSADEQDKANQKTEQAKTVYQEFHEAVAQQSGNLVGKFMELKSKWDRLTDKAEQIKWLQDNQTEFNNLGLKVDDLTDAENVFNKNTSKVVKALELRARAMAAQSLIVEQYKKYYEKVMAADNSVAGGGYYNSVKAGSSHEQGSQIMKELTAAMKANGAVASDGSAYNDGSWYTMSKGQFILTEKAANAINANRNKEALKRNRTAHAQADQELNKATKYLNDIISSANESIEALGIEQIDFNRRSGGGSGTGNKPKGSGKGNKPTQKPKTPEELRRETYNTIQGGIGTAVKDLMEGLFPDDEIRKRLEALNQQLKDNNFEPIDVDLIIKQANIKKLHDRFDEISGQFADGLIDQNTFDNQVKEINKKLKELGATEISIKTKAEIKMEAIDEFEKQASFIQDCFDKGVISIQEANDELKKLNETAVKLGQKPIVLKVKTELEKKQESVEELHTKHSEIQKQFELGIVTQQQYINKTIELNNALQQLGAKPIEIDIKTNMDEVLEQMASAFEQIETGFSAFKAVDGVVGSIGSLSDKLKEGANAWEIFMGVVEVASSVLTTIQAVMTAVNLVNQLFNANTLIGAAAQTSAATASTVKAGADTAQIASTTAATVAIKTQEAALLDLAAAEIFAAHAYIPFAGVGIASGLITTMMAVMTAQKAASLTLAAFADGGVVKGSQFHGDNVLIRANAGETVLTRKQSADLYHAIKSGQFGNNLVSGEIKIKGSDLYIALNNYNKKMNRVR